MMITVSLLLALCGAPAGAVETIVAPDAAVNPIRSVYPSPFYDYFKDPAALDAARAAAPSLEVGPAPVAPRLAAVTQAPALAASEIPAARDRFHAAVESMRARKDITPEQRSAVASVARLAFESKDVDTLAQLALLTSRERERALHDLLVEALNVMKNRVLTPESQDAGMAIRTLSTAEPLSDASRAWVAEQVRARAARRHLALPAQLELPLGR